MIIYTTKLMRDRYKIKMSEDYIINKDIVGELIEKESGDRMLEWGAKLFYFTGGKCIQRDHFASKITVFCPPCGSLFAVLWKNLFLQVKMHY